MYKFLFGKQYEQYHNGWKLVKKEIPASRLRQFRNAWIINNIVRAPVRKKIAHSRLSHTYPNIINISPSYRCNLSCKGCFASSYETEIPMKPGQLDGILTTLKKHGVYFTSILGGEPLLRKDLFEVYERHPEIAFRISTNGQLIDEEITEFLRNNGNIVLFFSLEGIKDYTDQWRGDGVYEKIIRNMQILKNEKIIFGFASILHNQNMNHVLSYDFLRTMQNNGCRLGAFYPYGPVGKNQIFNIVVDQKKLDEKYIDLLSIQKKLSLVIILEGYDMAAGSSNTFYNKGCRAGINVHITSEGNIEPCNGIHFYTKNIYKDGLSSVRKDPFYNAIQNAIRDQNLGCMAIFEPEILESIVNKYKPRQSYRGALDCLIAYTKYRKETKVMSHED